MFLGAAPDLQLADGPPPLGTVASAGSGSVDAGGPMDRAARTCAAWVSADSDAGRQLAQFEQSGVQQWSYDNFGMPAFAPSLQLSLLEGITSIFGVVAAGYHGHRRSGGHVLPTLGWAAFGYFFPIVTVSVAMFSGYGQRAPGSRRRA